jgi:hypothetical protein
LSKILQALSISLASCGLCRAIFGNEFSNRLASLLSIAIIDSTFVSVLATNWSVDHSFNSIASSYSAGIWLLDGHYSVDTVSCCGIASSSCTFVAVITSSLFEDAVSADARIISAKIVIVTDNRGVDASRMRIAAISSARIVVVT